MSKAHRFIETYCSEKNLGTENGSERAIDALKHSEAVQVPVIAQTGTPIK